MVEHRQLPVTDMRALRNRIEVALLLAAGAVIMAIAQIAMWIDWAYRKGTRR